MEQSSTNKEHAQLLHSQNSAEKETESKTQSGEIIYRESLDDSAIILIKENDKWFAILGKNRISEDYNTKEELLEFTKTWRFKLSVFSVVAEHIFIELLKERNQEYVATLLREKSEQ